MFYQQDELSRSISGDIGFGPDLLSLTKLATNFSGRTLRKLPFQAVAFHMKERKGGQAIALTEFFAALARAVKAEVRARDDMTREINL